MRGRYTTIYLRKAFEVTDVDAVGTLKLEAKYDDGVNIWINGFHVASGNVPSDELPFNDTVNNRSENHNFSFLRCLRRAIILFPAQMLSQYRLSILT